MFHKALYGLRKARRPWNIKFDQVLREINFKKYTKESSVYHKNEGDFLLVVIYVDDIFVIGTSLKVIKQFKEEMSRKFEMSLSVKQKADTLTNHYRGLSSKT